MLSTKDPVRREPKLLGSMPSRIVHSRKEDN